MNDDLIASDDPLSREQRRTLKTLAGCIISASERHAVPGADDEGILADIRLSMKPYLQEICEGLEAVEQQSLAQFGTDFTSLSAADRERLAQQLKDSRASWVDRLVSVVVHCYYRDDRVLQSLGIEARPPFPEGYTLDTPGGKDDWGLLENVRKRPKLYRE